MARKMTNLVDDVNYYANAVLAHTTNARQIVPAATVCLVGAVMAFAPFLVNQMTASAGLFLALLSSVQRLGKEAERLFSNLIQVQLSLSSLLKISMYMNLETDVPERMLANRKMRQRGRVAATNCYTRAAQSKASCEPHSPQDGSNHARSVDDHVGAGTNPACEPLPEPSKTYALGLPTHFKSVNFAADDMEIELINVGLAQKWNVANPTSSISMESDASVDEAVRSRQLLFTRASNKSNKSIASSSGSHLMRSPLQHINLRLPQGKMYAVVGSQSNGKSSLLRLLGKAVHPTRGEVFIPPHLSIVHVEQEPQLLRHLSLLDNITLGYKHGCPQLEQVVEVCDALGLAPKWIAHLRAEASAAEEQVGVPSTPVANSVRLKTVSDAMKAEVGLDISEQSSWQDQLSATDRRVIQLARALILNPHVLVLHRPLASLDEDVAACVLAALRRFIERRSLFADNSPASLLSRTVFFSTSTLDERAIEAADEIVVVGTPRGGASLLRQDLIAQSSMVSVGEAADESSPSRPEALRRICSGVGAAMVADETIEECSTDLVAQHMCKSAADIGGHKSGSPSEGVAAHTGAVRTSVRIDPVARSHEGRTTIGDTSTRLVSHAELLVKRHTGRTTMTRDRRRHRKSSVDLESLL